MTQVVIGGRYIVQKKLAEGGMSLVYLARDKKTGRSVALKLQKPEPSYERIFKNEAKTALRLHQKNIIHTLDAGIDDNIAYIAMEYVPGCNLKQYIDKNGALSPQKAVSMAKQICQGLAYAHNRGVVHKDLKPHNVLLLNEEVPIISDFGIAFGEDSGAEGEVMGSVHYFSPEQAKGEEVDKRSDIYSLGIMLYEMLTGELPYVGTDKLSVALMHLHQPPVPPRELRPEIPESLNRIILKAISKDIGARYQSAMEMFRDLSRALAEPEGDYVFLTGDEKVDEPHQSHRLRVRNVAVVLICSVVIIAALIYIFTSVIGVGAKPEVIYMPLVTDIKLDEATASLRRLGLGATVEYEYDVQRESGYVIRQTPEQGSVLKAGDEVKLVVAKNDVVALMPSLIGLSREAALSSLTEYGVDAPKIETATDPDSPDNSVIYQSPNAGEPLGGEPVTIIVNVLAKQERIEVPQLIDKEAAEAVYDAAMAGFTSIVVEETDEGERARVSGQLPEEGERIFATDELQIRVGRGEEPRYKGVLNVPPLRFEGESEITVLTEGEYAEIPVTLMLYRRTFEGSEDFIEKTDGIINIDVYIDSEEATLEKEATLYIGGAKAAVMKLTLSREPA